MRAAGSLVTVALLTAMVTTGCQAGHQESRSAAVAARTVVAAAPETSRSPDSPGPTVCGGEVVCPPPGPSEVGSARSVCAAAAAVPSAWDRNPAALRPLSGATPAVLASYSSLAGALSRWDFGNTSVEQLDTFWPGVPAGEPATLCYLAGPFMTSDGRRFATAIVEVVDERAELTIAGAPGQAILLAAPPAATPTLTESPASVGTAPVPAPSAVLASDGPEEGPRIMWDARLNNSVVVTPAKLASFPGLAFVPVLPAFTVPPSRIDVSTDPAAGSAGGMVELHFTFATSSAFPVDGRVIVREQPVATAVGGLDKLARGVVPPTGGQRIIVAGHVSWLTDTDGSFTLFTVRGKALVLIAGPAVPRAEVLKLAAKR
jgi:hypothetical protein